jgi:DNA primase
MRLDSDFIDRVRNSVSIIDVVGDYVRLKKTGQNHWALCPFHNESAPSFSVSETKQIFKCFGCGQGGDVFGFIRQIESLSFVEAVLFIAERSGIQPPGNRADVVQKEENRSGWLKMMDWADRFFRESLARSRSAQAYLNDRQIEEDIIEKFGIGFAPPGNNLCSLLKEQGYSYSEIERVGLANRNDAGEYYDKFRNRICFPIKDIAGRTIAFGGRILGDGKPKYLNSPETPLYSKGRHLYALNVTREQIRKRDFGILVEGYFDCIVPFQFGIQNLVASLGTALTENQVRLLGRYTRNVVVSFDPDSAGVTASLRSIDSFLEHGFHVNVLQLPLGQDPDSFIIEHGVEAYLDRLRSSSPFLDFLMVYFQSQQRDPFSPKGKQRIVDSVLPYLKKVSNRIERSEYVSRVASRLQVNDELINSELRRLSGRSSRRIQRTVGNVLSEVTPAERTLLKALFEKDSELNVLARLDTELFEGLRTEALVKGIFELKNRNDEISVLKLRELLEVDDRDLLDRLIMGASELELSEEGVSSSVDALRNLQLERLSREVQAEIQREEESGVVSPRMDDLLRKKEALRRQRLQ